MQSVGTDEFLDLQNLLHFLFVRTRSVAFVAENHDIVQLTKIDALTAQSRFDNCTNLFITSRFECARNINPCGRHITCRRLRSRKGVLRNTVTTEKDLTIFDGQASKHASFLLLPVDLSMINGAVTCICIRQRQHTAWNVIYVGRDVLPATTQHAYSSAKNDERWRLFSAAVLHSAKRRSP